MAKQVVYSCPCLNIRIHLSTKYNLDTLKDNFVQEPLPGWEFDLGMGGIVTEFTSFVSSNSVKPEWNTFECLHCNKGNVYSLHGSELQGSANRVVIHENAICGQAYQDRKQEMSYSKTFNINLEKRDSVVSMPDSKQEVPDDLVSAYIKIQSVWDQSIEQMRIESKVRIEEYKKQEEKKLQELITQAKHEKDILWSSMVQSTLNKPAKEHKQDQAKKNQNDHRVRFAGQEEAPCKRTGFDLDESAINTLRHVDMDQYKLQDNDIDDDDDDVQEEQEDMFHLDEEFSDEEKEDKKDQQETVQEQQETQDNTLLSASLKKSISEIDQRFSWIKKKRNTSKYLTQDFNIKADLKGNSSKKTSSNDTTTSMFATSVPIAIHYPFDSDADKQNDNLSPKKKDILASSFANYDSSFSDRILSQQFPAPRRRKSVASTSLIRPQLESLLMGKSLDTRGLVKKNKETSLKNTDSNSDDEFDSSLPPHVWAAMKNTETE